MSVKNEKKLVQSYPNFMPRSMKLLLAWLENFGTEYRKLIGFYGITALMADIVDALIAVMKTTIKAVLELTALLKEWTDARNLVIGTDPKPLDKDVLDPGDWKSTGLAAAKSGAMLVFIEMAKTLDVQNLSAQHRTALRLTKPEATPSNRKETAEKLDYPFTELVQVGDNAVLRTTRGNRYAGLTQEIKVDRKGDGVFLPYDKNTDKETIIYMDFKPGEKVKSVTVTCVYVKNGQLMSKWSPEQSISIQKVGPVVPEDVPAAPAPEAPPTE